MIYDYEIKKQNHEEVLYLYFDFNNEFAKLNTQNKKKKLKETVEDFIKNNRIAFQGTKVALVVGGLVIGTLLVNSPNHLNTSPSVEANTYAINTLVPFLKEENVEEVEEIKRDEKVQVEEKEQNITTNNKKTNTTKSTTKAIAKTSTSTLNNSQTSEVTSSKESIQEPEEAKTYVQIHRANGTILALELEEYLIGVVGAEMPASFHEEALKAQAILARTYTLKALERGITLTDTSSTQNYKSDAELKNLWGSSYNTYYNKIKKSVETTKGMYLTYHGEIIDAVYHSTSNGTTEDASNVWGNVVPYLVSVDSNYDSSNPSFLKEQFLSYEELTRKLGMPITIDTSFLILNRTSGNRVGTLEIDGMRFTGVNVRNLLGLRSADFEIIKAESGITFTTKGYGHGVGMSQYGANGMAKNGSSYLQILKHYYTGVTLSYS